MIHPMRHRRAFTLIELLVVIGIILIVVGLVVPMTMKALRSGAKARQQADLNTIAVAIQSFKDETGDIPRPPTDINGNSLSGQNVGFACLGRYLIGPYGAGTLSVTTPTAPYKAGDCAVSSNNTYLCTDDTSTAAPASPWVSFPVLDRKDGPGMKNGLSNRAAGPYLNPDKFKLRGLAILDAHGNPILYFPGAPKKPNIHATNGYATASTSTAASLYNLGDGEIPFRVGSEAVNTYSVGAMQMQLGDINHNGMIDAGEEATNTGEYILWSAGADAIYGVVRADNTYPTAEQVKKSDDVIGGK